MVNDNGKPLEELAATLHNSMRESVDLNDPALIRRLVVLLSEGHAVSPERLAADLEPSRERVISTSRKRLNIEWDAAGNVSPVPALELIE